MRETKRLSPNDVQSAISYSQSAKIVGRIAEWRDLKTVGLTLRISPRQAVWYVRRRDITLRLGFASEIDLNRDSPDDSRIGADIRGFPAFRQDRSEFRTATVTSDGPNGGRGADLAIFAGIWTHSSHRQLLNA